MYKLELRELNSIITNNYNIKLYLIVKDLEPSKYETLTDYFFTVIEKDGVKDEFPSFDIDHLFSNLSSCGVPSYIIYSLVETELSINIPDGKDWKKIAKKYIKKAELVNMEYHEFIYTYTSFITMDTFGYNEYIKKSKK